MSDKRCCGHDHVGPDELWLSIDDMLELIRLTVHEILAAPGGRLPADERAAIRARYDEQHQGDNPGPRPRRAETFLWGSPNP